MMSHDRDQVGSKAPIFCKQMSAIAVRKPKRSLLSFMQGNTFRPGNVESCAEFLRQNP